MPPPRGLVQRFDEHLHRSGLLAPKSRLLVAVSGGADSVGLLRLLHAVNGGKYWRFTLVCGHVNHRTRGRESDGDEKFVKKLAGELKVKFVSRKLSASAKKSEAALRDARLNSLKMMAKATRSQVIVLAHHADDQAETVLMRILRGTALHGLSGIAAESFIGVKLVRPLLGFSPEELRNCLREIKQPWREDASNRSGEYLRNRIRHEVMPLLEKLQPGAKKSLVRLAERAEEAQSVMEMLANQLASDIALRVTRGRAVMGRAGLRRAPRAVVAVLLRNVIEKIGGKLESLTAERIGEAARIAIGIHGGKTVQLGGGVTMKVEGKRLIFEVSPLRGSASL
jgi:tRNA(Ile)-lysidine synthase